MLVYCFENAGQNIFVGIFRMLCQFANFVEVTFLDIYQPTEEGVSVFMYVTICNCI